MRDAPNCYACVFRESVPGDAHSACVHPLVRALETKALCTQAVLQFGGFTTEHLTVRFNKHGVRNGWAFYPINFDPVWLEACSGFTAAASAQSTEAA